MDLIKGWSATWRDHSGKSWELKGAGQLPNANANPPLRTIFQGVHDVRLQLFSPDTSVDAAAFFCSFKAEKPDVSPHRCIELTWEFGCTSAELWALGVDLIDRAQAHPRLSADQAADGPKPIYWSIEGKEGADDGETTLALDLPKSDEIVDRKGFSLAVGDVEILSLPFIAFGSSESANVIWPPHLASLDELKLAELIVRSQPKRFARASVEDVRTMLTLSMAYLHAAPTP